MNFRCIHLVVFMVASSLFTYAQETTTNNVTAKDINGTWITVDKSTNLPFTGVIVKYYPDGARKSEETYFNGKLHGLHLTWDPNGRLRSQFEYINGQRGKLRLWYPDGTLFVEADINQGRGKAYQIAYYSSGEHWTEVRSDHDKNITTEQSWLKDGTQVGNGTYDLRRKNRNGTFCDFEYDIPVVSKYLKGHLVATTDAEGKVVDVSKLRRLTQKEMTEKGLGVPIGFSAEFK